MLVRAPESRPARPLDYAARVLTLALPHGAAKKVDQARRDLHVLAGAVRGERPAPVATLQQAVTRAVGLEELGALGALPEFMGNPVKAARRDAQVLFDALVHGRRPSPLVKRGARHGDASQAQVVALAGAPSLTGRCVATTRTGAASGQARPRSRATRSVIASNAGSSTLAAASMPV